MNRQWISIFALLFFVSLAGCSTLPNQTAKIADVGINYVDSTVATAKSVESYAIEADYLVLKDALADKNDTATNEEKFDALQSQYLEEGIGLVVKARLSSQLLATYFEELKILASSEDPEAAADALKTTASSLQKLVTSIAPGASSGLSAASGVVSTTASLAMSGLRNSLIRKSLEEDGPVVLKILQIQQDILMNLKHRYLKSCYEIYGSLNNSLREQYLSGKLSADWQKDRKRMLVLKSRIELLKESTLANNRMVTLWASFIEGKYDDASYEAVLSDIKLLNKIIEDLS